MKRIFTIIMILLLAGASIDSQGVKLVKPRFKTFKAKVKGRRIQSVQGKLEKNKKIRAHQQTQTFLLSSQERILRRHYQTEMQKGELRTPSQRLATTYLNHNKSPYRKADITTTISRHDYSQEELSRLKYELSVLPVKDLYEIDSYSFEMPYVDFCIDYMLVFPIRMLSNLGYAIEYNPVEKISEMGYIMSLSPKQFANLCHSVYLKRKSSGIEPEYVLERDREDNEGAIVLIPRRAVLKNLLLNEGFGSSRKSGEHPNDDFFASQNGSQGQSSGDRLKDIWRDCNDELDDPDYLHTLVELLEDILSGSGDSGGGSSDDDDDDDTSDSGESSKESKESKALEAQENPHQTCLIQP